MLLVETTGSFQLQDYPSRGTVRATGYTVIARSEQLEVWVGERKLRIVADLGDEATDAEWLDYLAASDGDLTLARASFVSTFPPAGFVPPEVAEGSKKRK